MLEEFIKGKVYYKVFDKTYLESTGIYRLNKFNANESESMVRKNILAVKEEFAADKVVILDQTHSNIVIIPERLSEFEGEPVGDAMLTCKSKIALAIQTADCVPVLFSSEDGLVVGAAHCGWKGIKGGIIHNLVSEMQEAGATNIKAIIGPSIAQESYEVDEIYYQNFVNDSAEYSKLFIPSTRQGRYMFDIAGMVKMKLMAENVGIYHHINHDTYKMSDKYPSYRRTCLTGEPYESSILSVIMLKD